MAIQQQKVQRLQRMGWHTLIPAERRPTTAGSPARTDTHADASAIANGVVRLGPARYEVREGWGERRAVAFPRTLRAGMVKTDSLNGQAEWTDAYHLWYAGLCIYPERDAALQWHLEQHVAPAAAAILDAR